MTHVWRKQMQYCSKPASGLSSPFQPHCWPCSPQEWLPSSNTSFISCLHLVLDTSLCPCWVIDLFHWLKWRTSQVSKYLNMAMLQSQIFFFCVFMISLHTVLEVSAQRLPKDQAMSLVGEAGSEAGPSYFPSTGLVVCLRLLHPSLGNLCLSSALKKHKIFLPSRTTVSGGQGRACCITKCF